MSLSAEGKFLYPVGRHGAEQLGYDTAILHDAHPCLLESFCGVGNPFSLGPLKPGSSVLDFGCGAGFDLYIASRLVGNEGMVCGIDLTPQMADKARLNLAEAGRSNVDIKMMDSECIPYADSTFDMVISNGVINLVPQKPFCFKELFRVLKPGGRIQIADIVLEQELPSSLASSAEAWSQ